MVSLLKTRETAVWLLLMLVSIANWLVGGQQGVLNSSARAEVIVLLSLAFLKVSLIMQYFMEVRHASNDLRITAVIWLLASYALVLSANVGVFS